MKHLRWTAIILFLISALPAASEEQPEFSSYGFDLLSRAQQNRQILYKLNDTDGLAITIVSEQALSKPRLEQVSYFHNIFTNWEYLEISSMIYVFYEQELEININPRTFRYQNIDFTRYISAGLGFFHTNVTTYNFRLNIEGKYPRIEGRLTTEEDLCEAILAAIENPAEAVEPQAEELRRMPATKDDLTGLGERLHRLEEHIAEIESRQKQLKGQLQNRNSENAELRDNLEKLRKAVLVLHNMGLFGNIHVIDRDGIKRILELKAEDPDLMQEEVSSILHKEGFSLSAHEIFLIFSVYFNEFK